MKIKMLSALILLTLIIECSNEYFPAPRLTIKFPREYPYNIVGNNVIMRIILNIENVTWVKAISGKELLMFQKLDRDLYAGAGEVWIDINYFGIPGRKKVRLIGGNEGEEVAIDEIEIINDDKLLEQEAIKYIKAISYPNWINATRPSGIMMDRRIYIYSDTEQEWDRIDKAIGYWNKWGGGFLDFERVNEIKAGTIYIKKSSGGMAWCIDFKAKPLCKICQVLFGYDPWDKEYEKIALLVHEMGHCLGIGDVGGYPPAIGGNIPSIMGNMRFIYFNAFEQKALQLIYSTDPPGSFFF